MKKILVYYFGLNLLLITRIGVWIFLFKLMLELNNCFHIRGWTDNRFNVRVWTFFVQVNLWTWQLFSYWGLNFKIFKKISGINFDEVKWEQLQSSSTDLDKKKREED